MPFLCLLAIFLVSSLSACVAIPVQRADEEPFKDERLIFIEIGKTTKEEIAAAMSDFAKEKDNVEERVNLLPQKFRGGDWWLYTESRSEAQWLWVYAAPSVLPDVGVNKTGKYDYHYLLIKFDDNGVVTGYETSSAEGDGCNRNGVCQKGPYYMLLASLDEDRVVKQFHIPADRCGVYVYGKPKFAVPIWLDGHLTGWLLNNQGFLFLQLDLGVHQLSPLSPVVSNQTPVKFECVAGDSYFFESMQKASEVSRHSSWTEIEQRDAVKGRQAVGERRLMLTISETAH
jgi:hypothetical protein